MGSGPIDQAKFDRYQEMLIDGHESLKGATELATELGITRQTVWAWSKQVDWEWVKAERRKRYAPRMAQVDDAMFRAAIKGDVAAAKYVAERFDNYVPTSAQVTLNKDTDAELLERAGQIRKQLEGGFRSDQPGTSAPAVA